VSTARSNAAHPSGANSSVGFVVIFAMPKPSLPESRDERARAYLNVLFEIDSRLNYVLALESANLPFGLAREICQLQFRHVCELVAIGCLVIQGDYKSLRIFHDEYNPQTVFKGMSRLFQGFFPQSAEMVKNEKEEIIEIVVGSRTKAITRSELEQLWNKSGNYLHRLKIHNFFKSEHWSSADIWPEVRNTVARIRSLLNPHVISMHSPKLLVVAGLDGDRGKPNLMFVAYRLDGAVDISHFHGRGETPFWR